MEEEEEEVNAEERSQTAEDVRDNIVKITDEKSNLSGTGFFIDKEYCITCHHNICRLDEIYVERENYNTEEREQKKRFSAQWVEEFSDMQKDIAFLKVQGANVKPLKYGRETYGRIPVVVRGFPSKDEYNFPDGKVETGTLGDGRQRIRIPEEEVDQETKEKKRWNIKPEVNVQVYTFSGRTGIGFGGAPVCYEQNWKVVGMFEAKDENQGYVIPMDIVVEKFISQRSSPSEANFVQGGSTGGPSTHISTDRWTLDDALGYRAYAHAIARFITHKQTGKPLCISIQAPWGGGKTTLMRMIQSKLDPKAVAEFTTYNKENVYDGAKMQDILRNMESPDRIPLIRIKNEQEKVKPLITIWFNAWKYESTEQVWSGLADTIVQQVSARLPSKERDLFFFQLHLRRINKDAIRQRFQNRVLNKWIQRTRPRIWKYLLPIGISIAVAAFGWLGSNDSYLNSIEKYIGIAGIGGLVTSIVVGALQILQEHQKAEADAKEEDAKVNIQDYLDLPNYNTTVGFIHQVEKDLQHVFDVVDDKFLPMVIFIDDLDRCSPDKVASAMEAINLFLAGEFPNCVFVLGMDPEMVAAALEKAHSEVISKLKSYSTRTPIGWRFMDKFVQLPFIIPPPERKDLNKYIEALLAKKEESPPSDKNDTNDNSVIELSVSEQRGKIIQTSEGQDVQIQKDEEQLIDQNIERFSDQDDEIRKQMLKAAREFSSTNPREIKRFLNVFRFYYFLRAARISRSLSVPSLEELTEWIILTLKWPEVTRWIQWSPAWEDGKQLTKMVSINHIYLRLKLLEDAGEKCYKDSKKDWKTEMESAAELKQYSSIWTSDKGLENFFKDQGSRSKEKRLSAAVGTGFF